MTWITDNWSQILGVVGFLLAAAHIVVKLTPTTADDEVEAKVVAVLKTLGVKIPE